MECSRKDIISNIAVLVAAAGVWLFQAGWPDLVVGLALSLLLINSTRRVFDGGLAGNVMQIQLTN